MPLWSRWPKVRYLLTSGPRSVGRGSVPAVIARNAGVVMGRNAKFAVDMRVRVNRGDAKDVHGVIVEDYGDHAGYSVDVGEKHIVDAARRWAVLLDSGSLVFADDAHLKPE